jgi:hypothetical protein
VGLEILHIQARTRRLEKYIEPSPISSVVENGRAKRRTVKIGQRNAQGAEVLERLLRARRSPPSCQSDRIALPDYPSVAPADAQSWIAATCGTPRSGSIFVGGYRTGANIPDHHRFKERIMS